MFSFANSPLGMLLRAGIRNKDPNEVVLIVFYFVKKNIVKHLNTHLDTGSVCSLSLSLLCCLSRISFSIPQEMAQMYVVTLRQCSVIV